MRIVRIIQQEGWQAVNVNADHVIDDDDDDHNDDGDVDDDVGPQF